MTDSKLSHLSRLSVALCVSDESTILDCFRQALKGRVTAIELREVILTTYLFDGYPTALEGFRLLSDVVGSSTGKHSNHKYSSVNIKLWQSRGEKLCNRIYGPQYEPLMARVAEIAPELRYSMIVEGYGKVLARSEMDTMFRELCVVSILIAKNRPRQLMSHSLGAIRLGANENHFDTVLKAVSDTLPSLNLQPATSIINSALTKRLCHNGR